MTFIENEGATQKIRKSISNAQVTTTRMLTPTFISLLSDVRATIQKRDKRTPKKQKKTSLNLRFPNKKDLPKQLQQTS